jgi:opacity protein-like surface antigen
MKLLSHTLSIAGAIFCAALCFGPLTASSDELADFFTKFNPTDPCDWSGAYCGVNVGGTWNHFDIGKQRTDVNLVDQFYDLINKGHEGNVIIGQAESGFATFPVSGHEETSGRTIGGMQSGFNLQFGHFVFGAEGSFIGNGTTASKHFQDFQTNVFSFDEQPPITADTKFTSWRMLETTWNGFVGGRLGFCWNRFLFYGTGGVAFTDVRFTSMQRADTSFFGFVGDGTGASTASNVRSRRAVQPQQGLTLIGSIISTKNRTETDVLTGYYGGAGTEYKLTDNVSVALEYRHAGWGDTTGEFMPGPNDGPVFPTDNNLHLSGDQVVFKVNVMVAHLNPFH